ncbi:MAG: succinate dehydrogenase, cytochrome b556 subunit [Chloroflexi bacterium]|nr:succinate dehydrogenase, cytochrome b556 subunit [Chloroflexota bacterium]MCL5074810.1 succinate dehydrogenase, cytochrome b556 subunit [Chloroflexota bacterium]
MVSIGVKEEVSEVGLRPEEAGIGVWSWVLQRVTAVLLLVFLGAHFWVLHFAVVGEQINFVRVSERLRTPFFIVLDLALLATVLYHALNGLRIVIVDFGISPMAQRLLLGALWLIGILTFIFGANTLLPFITSTPLFYR